MGDEGRSGKESETRYGLYVSGNDGDRCQEEEYYSDTCGCHESSENVERTVWEAVRSPNGRKASASPTLGNSPSHFQRPSLKT